MDKFYRSLASLMLIFLGIQMNARAMEQINNRAAVRWFNKGTRETDPYKKIEAYQKAIELEPKFVEALYNLGLTYKRVLDYENAEKYFMRAYIAKPDKTPNELKLRLLYELSFVYKKLGKLKDSEEALRGAKALTTDKEMQAKISYEIGRLLYEQSRYQKALAELERGKDILPEYRGQFSRLIGLAENMLNLQRLYEEAGRAEKKGDFKRARSLFQQIYATNKDFRNVAKKLNELDSLVSIENEKNAVFTLIRQAEKYEQQGQLELAIALYEKVLQKKDSDAMRQKLKDAQSKFHELKIQKELEDEYASGMKALKSQNWPAAIYSFEKIVKSHPDFRDARKKLARARRSQENENIKNLMSQYYADGLQAYDQQELERAQSALEKVYKLNPNYKNVQEILKRIKNQATTAHQQKSESQTAQADPAELDSLYQNALALMDQKRWQEASVQLEKIRILAPKYRNVLDLLANIHADLANPRSESGNPSLKRSVSSIPFWGGIALGALVIPLMGLFLFSQSARARLHLMRGNYLMAAQIYEHILEKNPGKIKLYGILAELYLLMGRKDEQAMKIFKMIVRLNLPTPKQEEISTLLTQNYLKEGRTDDDAIAVLEAALKAESQKINSNNFHQGEQPQDSIE